MKGALERGHVFQTPAAQKNQKTGTTCKMERMK